MTTKKGPMGADMTMVSLATEDRLRTLERLRDRLAEELDVSGDARAVVLLATRLQDVLREIDALLPVTMSSPADRIAARRAERRKRSSA